MSHLSRNTPILPPEQQAIRDKCFHPTGTFIEFRKEEIEQSIPDRFEQQVQLYPHRLAVKTRSHELTYDELNKAANQVARAILAKCGNGYESIALIFEQGAPVIAAILGVLKAGQIYVPLDPTFPRARINYMLEDSQARIILTNSKNLSLASTLAQDPRQLLNIEEMDSDLATGNLGLTIPPDSPACIYYTSGSTAQPKGVAQPHRNLLHQAMKHSNQLHICAEDRLTILSSPTSIGTIWWSLNVLLNGAALFPIDIRGDGFSHLADWLAEQEITIHNIGPAVFRQFAGTLTGEEQFPKLRLIQVGGERVYKGDVELYKKFFSRDCIFINHMGSTETGTIRMYFVDKETPITVSNMPVGYPVEDTEILLLGDDGREVGFNQVGEIAVKSRYLATGYWRRPDLTQAAFLPDPNDSDVRIYLTGDLGRVLPDGCIEHLGRKDLQVKIRNYKVEPSVIENALLVSETIKDAVVLAHEDRPGDRRLVAYLVPARNPHPTVTELRRFLAETFPDYMIPSAFVMLNALPLTPSGKVDRQALPAPSKARPRLESDFFAPRNPLEEKLANIWAEVLGLDQVGIHDSFDSLLASQVIARVIKTFQVEVPLRSLWESPTISDMAVVIVQNQAKEAEEEDLNRMLAELETLSDEQAQRLLSDEDESSKASGV